MEVVALFIFCILFFVGYAILKYLDGCKHNWDLVSSDQKGKHRSGSDHPYMIVYIHEYKCNYCGIHKVTKQEV